MVHTLCGGSSELGAAPPPQTPGRPVGFFTAGASLWNLSHSSKLADLPKRTEDGCTGSF